MLTFKRFGFYRLTLRGGTLREGVLIEFDKGIWGDAAPLPGWSLESLDEVVGWLRKPEGLAPPSVQAAFEMAQTRTPQREIVPINALLSGNVSAIKEQGRRALAAGSHCLKIKASSLSVAELQEILNELMSAGGNIRFRIDPNRSWTIERTRQVAAALRSYPIEYFEEPVLTYNALRELAEDDIPVALDETLREIEPDQLATFRKAKALVLKPTLMGGFEVCRLFAEEAARLGLRNVISACYESGVGISALGKFAASLPHISDAGLDTYSALEEDVLVRRLEMTNFKFNALHPCPEVDLAKLVF